MTDKLTTASVLAFERKLDPSDAVFHAGRWDDRAQSHAWQLVTVREKSVRGTSSPP
jgi:CRISPR-associated protein Csy3